MKLYAGGIVTNEFNEVLLIQRDDSRTWANPGGAIEAGELPTEAVSREVAEETGIKVLPVRLVGLYYRPEQNGTLLFFFRCLQRGGAIQTSNESLQVRFWPANPLPKPMLAIHQEMIQRGLAHQGGRPYWGQQRLAAGLRLMRWLIYSYRNSRRRLLGQPAYQSPPGWKVGAFSVIRNPAGAVLWVQRTDNGKWNLPGGGRNAGEAPWQTAIRETKEETGLTVSLDNLTGVYVKPAEQEIVFTFTAQVTAGQLQTGPEAADFAYWLPGREAPNSLPRHIERVQDALADHPAPMIRPQSS